MFLKGKVVKVENSDSYTVTDVTRESTGEYKCSIIDNAKMEDSKNIAINCKSLFIYRYLDQWFKLLIMRSSIKLGIIFNWDTASNFFNDARPAMNSWEIPAIMIAHFLLL